MIAEMLPKDYFARIEADLTLEQLQSITPAVFEEESGEGVKQMPPAVETGKAPQQISPKRIEDNSQHGGSKTLKTKRIKIVFKDPTLLALVEDYTQNTLMSLLDVKEVEDIDLLLMVLLSLDRSPTFKDAMESKDKEEWIESIKNEYQNMLNHKVFQLQKREPEMKKLKSKLVLKLKETEIIDKFQKKARLVIQGFLQQYGLDYDETYAPVVQMHFLRLMLAFLALIDYEIHTGDITAAFLNALLKETIYLEIPDGYPMPKGLNKKDYVLKLLKTLYGLKQSPREWNSAIDTLLKELGFKALSTENCIYQGHYNNHRCYIILYVDDIIFGCPNLETITKLKNAINIVYKMRDKGPIEFFLHMHITRDRFNRTITITQPQKIDDILKLTELENCVPNSLPANPNIILTKDDCPPEGEVLEKPYRTILGKLLYLSLSTRPDITTAVSNCGRFAANPGPEHWKALMYIVQYLKGTRDFALTLGGGKPEVSAFADASWIIEHAEGRSRSGGVIFFGDGTIHWSSKLQVGVSLSTCEAELVSLSSECQNVIELRRIINELGHPITMNQQGQLPPTTIFEDNASAIKVAENEKRNPGLRHMDMKHFFVRERVLKIKDIKLEHIESGQNVSDIFTKDLATVLFMSRSGSIGVARVTGI